MKATAMSRSTNGQPLAHLIACLLVLLVPIGCTPTGGFLTRGQITEVPGEYAQLTDVVFEASLPDGQSAKSTLFVELLDEVTGLAMNPTRVEMELVTDGLFRAKITAGVGSVIQYRYVSGESPRRIEADASGNALRYRLFLVSGASMLAQDEITAWNDESQEVPAGQVEGRLLDAGVQGGVGGQLVVVDGRSTTSTADGTFQLFGIPAGETLLTVYSPDGAYKPFQQGALVQTGATTLADIALERAPRVTVTFLMSPPEGETAGLPVRLIGNLSQLGNTFTDLEGGLSTLAARAPLMTLQADGRYSLTLDLPAGADLRYKYSQGDGFWNAEQTEKGHFRLRQMIVPAKDTTVEDQVASWTVGDFTPVHFRVTVPENTPGGDTVSIQLNPYGWTPPVPMWQISPTEWVYILNGPLHLLGNTAYRYCWNGECNPAVVGTAEPVDHEALTFTPLMHGATFQDLIPEWAAWPSLDRDAVIAPDLSQRSPEFLAGVALAGSYQPGWTAQLPGTFDHLSEVGAGWVIFQPVWSYSETMGGKVETTGSKLQAADIAQIVASARQRGLKVALYPSLVVEDSDKSNIESQTIQLRRFMQHFSRLAQSSGVEGLIIGSPEQRGILNETSAWDSLIGEMRAEYAGRLMWSVPFEPQDSSEMAIPSIDQLFLEVSQPSDAADTWLIDLQVWLDDRIAAQAKELPGGAVLSFATPAISLENCDTDECSQEQLATPAELDWQVDQLRIALTLVDERPWLQGFVSAGYHPLVPTLDRSSSIRGKPAEDLIWFAFQQFTDNSQ